MPTIDGEGEDVWPLTMLVANIAKQSARTLFFTIYPITRNRVCAQLFSVQAVKELFQNNLLIEFFARDLVPTDNPAVIIFHDRRSTEYSRLEHPERPARIARSVPLIQERHPEWEWRRPNKATEEMLLRAHSPEHLERIRLAAEDFDVDSPAYPNIFQHATRAAGAAVDVAREARNGNRSFSLMRPPGHHATRERAMGFCYFGNVAIAALNALEEGAGRVAIWDFDAHHGNGTEVIVANNPRIVFASVHQFPAYPGTGERSFANVNNFPVAPLAARQTHVREVQRALETLLAFEPDLLLVSAGFDAYSGDPLTQMTLEPEDFATFGRWLRETNIPAGAILEGGYSSEFPELVDAFLTTWVAGAVAR